MKEKIERFAKEEFEYERAELYVSVEELNVCVEEGRSYQGSFYVSNTAGTLIKGLVYTSNKHMEIETKQFMGKKNEIHYCFHGENYQAGDRGKGTISIISSNGEYELPFLVTVAYPSFQTSLGVVKDLFQFTGLAKKDWIEALHIFKSRDFKRVFLHQDEKNQRIYDQLLKSISGSQALEEFLIAVHKKMPVHLSADKMQFHYKIENQETFKERIVLTKDQWGYLAVRISAEGKFIIPEHKLIWADNFLENTYQLGFLVNTKYLKQGINEGKIIIETVYETLHILVSVDYQDEKEEDRDHIIKQLYCNLVETYLNFRNGKTDAMEYCKSSRDWRKQLSEYENSTWNDLCEIHYDMIEGKEGEVNAKLEKLKDKFAEKPVEEIVEYCGYCYLNALHTKAGEDIGAAVKVITRYYENGHPDWRILWLLFYLDSKYDKNQTIKLNEIKEQFSLGCHSPILYYEVCSIYEKEPVLLYELGKFELQIVSWGIRNGRLSHETKEQFIYLAAREKGFRTLVYLNLTALYKLEPSETILSAILTILIKGEKMEQRYFYWYQKGVEARLKLTKLYEFYMESFDESKGKELPQFILLYFMYHCDLSDSKKAFLYSAVIDIKEKEESIFRAYVLQIVRFVKRQLELHHINEVLAKIYHYYFQENPLEEILANELPYVLFQQQITCKNSGMKNVIVVHQELKDITIVPLKNQIANVGIYTDNYEILFEDGEGNRYVTIPYEQKKFMEEEQYAMQCYKANKENEMLWLHLVRKAERYQIYDEESIEIRKKIADLPELKDDYRRYYIQQLSHYYYNNYQGELLEEYLVQMDLTFLDTKERNVMLEYMVIRDLYDETYEALKQYGYQGLSSKRLLKLCSKRIDECGSEEKDEFLLEICFSVFQSGKYNSTILEYLVHYFNGTTREMFDLWSAAVAFEIKTTDLEERLLGQVLFAESYLSDAVQVFLSYYKSGYNQKLIRAFLSYHAYKYLIKDTAISEELFPMMRKELVYEENQSCFLALLKSYSEKDFLTDEEKEYVSVSIHECRKKGIFLPFFQNFETIISLPEEIKNMHYIQCITDPKATVKIHFMLEQKTESASYQEEMMKDMYKGIRVKSFLLFYNEILEYYITEEKDGTEMVLESDRLVYNHVIEAEESRYSHINLMLMSKDMNDEMTLLDTIKKYMNEEYAVSRLFQALEEE